VSGQVSAAPPKVELRASIPIVPKAWLFDLDGVLTDSASLHVRAWKEVFDAFLASSDATQRSPFDEVGDYERYVDGKPRDAGVRDFLASRGVVLPETEAQAAGAPSVESLANAKNRRFLELLKCEGVRVLPGSLALLDALRARNQPVAVVSASENTSAVLAAAGLAGRFDVQVDGIVAKEEGLRGKPAPDTYLYAVARLDAAPQDAAVLEDAPAGVAAGKAGGFGLVVGVARRASPEELRAAGAHLVVGDLAELLALLPSTGHKSTPAQAEL
jgi:beta-phosphoglucomutase family hydrolase